MVEPPERRVDSFPLGAADRDLPLHAALRGVALEIGRRALLLEPEPDAGPELPGETIHAVRVASKQLRALWQLEKHIANHHPAVEAIDRLRDAARTLAGQRDRQVLEELLAELEKLDGEGNPAAFSAAASALATSRFPASRAAEQGDIFRALEADAEAWAATTDVTTADLVDHGLYRCFAKAGEFGERALEGMDSEILHRWRRWVKYLRYQFEPLVGPDRPTITGLHGDLKKLGGLLGRRNDLHNLESVLLDSGAEADLGPVLDSVDRQVTALDEALRPLGEEIFRRDPAQLFARVRHDLGL